MVVGGSEAPIIPVGLGGFVACRALSTRNDEPEKASRYVFLYVCVFEYTCAYVLLCVHACLHAFVLLVCLLSFLCQHLLL